jgi:hypothetical protein
MEMTKEKKSYLMTQEICLAKFASKIWIGKSTTPA